MRSNPQQVRANRRLSRTAANTGRPARSLTSCLPLPRGLGAVRKNRRGRPGSPAPHDIPRRARADANGPRQTARDAPACGRAPGAGAHEPLLATLARLSSALGITLDVHIAPDPVVPQSALPAETATSSRFAWSRTRGVVRSPADQVGVRTFAGAAHPAAGLDPGRLAAVRGTAG